MQYIITGKQPNQYTNCDGKKKRTLNTSQLNRCLSMSIKLFGNRQSGRSICHESLAKKYKANVVMKRKESDQLQNS